MIYHVQFLYIGTYQLSPDRGSSVPQVERLSPNDGELSELERGKKKSTIYTTSLDDPQRILLFVFFYLSPLYFNFT